MMSKRKAREREIYRRELLKHSAQEKVGAEQILLGKRADSRRITRRIQLERRESEEEERIKALENRKALENQIKQEGQLLEELEKINNKEFVEMKIRQKIRENSEELRHLESQLRAAYINKELAAQLAGKEADRLANKYREELDMKMLRKQWEEEEKSAKEFERSKMECKAQYYQDLQKQEKNEEDKLHEAYEDFLREKMLIDEIVRIIHEEDQRELEELMMKKKKTKYELDEFRKSQDIWKQKERLAMEEENRRIVEFLKMKEEKELKMGEIVRERDRLKAAVTEKLMKFIEEQEMKRREEDEVLQDLVEEEMRLRQEQRAKFELQERLFKRYELQVSEACAREERLKKLAEEAQCEAKERQRMLEEMERNDKLEQLGEERRRRKKLEHRQAVEALLRERQCRREAEIAEIEALQSKQEEEQRMRWKAIEEERLNMLREHAVKLIGYLPRGVLREDDLPLLDLHSLKIDVSEEKH